MIITKKIDSSILETSVDVVSKTQEELEKINCALRAIDLFVVGTCDNVSVRVLFSDILYLESVDKNLFAYTKEKVIELSKRLYEVEETMPNTFLRVSKSVILNLSKVQSFFREFNGRIIANLDNKEKVVISRFYVQSLKEKLNGGRI